VTPVHSIIGVIHRLGRVLALCLLANMSAEISWVQRAEASSSNAPREVRVARRDAAGFLIEAADYRAQIAPDGNLHSLRVYGQEMIDDRIAISLGSFFYANGPRRLPTVQRRNPTSIEATDGTYSAQYDFSGDHIRILLRNEGRSSVPFFIVLSPAITIVNRLGTDEAAAAPTTDPWGDARFSTDEGAYLELSGGSRVWGPWLGRQVWEVSEVPPGETRRIVLRPGLGERPSTTLEQLVGVRAELGADTAIVQHGAPIELVVTLENRSNSDIRGDLAVEFSGTRNDVIIYRANPVEAPAQRVTEKTYRWNVKTPDFYRVRITAASEGRNIGEARAAAGYGVSRITPHVERPADFDDFWQGMLDSAGTEVPPYRMYRDNRLSRRGVDVWVVQYEGFSGKTIYGWYAVPADRDRLPAVLYLSGYGARPVAPPVGLASMGWAVFALDVRGNRVDRIRPKPFEDYCTEGIESAETYAYRDIVGHALRGLRLLRSRAEADPDRIAVVGVSEGAGVGLILAALDPEVAAVVADAPMLVEFPLSIRAGGWPYSEIARYIRRNPARGPRTLHTLSYFDVANFAPNIRRPVLLSIGLLDTVSLPTAVYGLYNLLPGPKEIQTFPKAGHEGGGKDYWTYKFDWLTHALHGRNPQ